MILSIDKDKTYTFHLKTRRKIFAIFCIGGCVISVILAVFLILLQAYIALLVPIAWIGCCVTMLILVKEHSKEYIIISPDGITLLGVKERSKNIWNNINSEQHILWEQIQNLGFSTFGLNPAFLFFDLTDGRCLKFPIGYFNNSLRIIDIIRKHIKCSNLGNNFRYLQTRFPDDGKNDGAESSPSWKEGVPEGRGSCIKH